MNNITIEDNNISLDTTVTTSNTTANSAPANSGPFFSAAINRLIQQGYEKLLAGSLPTNLPKLPPISGNTDPNDPDIAREMNLISLLLQLYNDAKHNLGDGDQFIPRIIGQYALLKSVLAGTSLGAALDKLMPLLTKDENHPSQLVSDMENSDVGFFSAMSDWFSDNASTITTYLNNPNVSSLDKLTFEVEFVQTMIGLMNSKAFNMGQGLDQLFFGFINANLGTSFPEMMYYVYYQQNLAQGMSPQAAMQVAQTAMYQLVHEELSPNPLGPNIPTPNYNAFLESMRAFVNNPQMPSTEEVEIDEQLVLQDIGNFLGS